MQSNPMQDNSKQSGSAQNINVVALAYMEEKYDEKFEYVAPFGNSMTGTHQLLVRCSSFPEENILVRIENYRRGDKVFLDNYLAVKYREATIAFISDCANQVYESASVFYDVDLQALSPDLSTNASFEEYLADTLIPFHIIVELKESDFLSKDRVQQFAELVAQHGSSYYLSLVFVNDADYGATDVNTLKQRMALGNYVHCAKVTHFSGVFEFRWLEGE